MTVQLDPKDEARFERELARDASAAICTAWFIIGALVGAITVWLVSWYQIP